MKIKLIDIPDRANWIINQKNWNDYDIEIVPNQQDITLCSYNYALNNQDEECCCIDIHDSCLLNSVARRTCIGLPNVKLYLRNSIFNPNLQYKLQNINFNQYINDSIYYNIMDGKTNLASKIELSQEILNKIKLAFPILINFKKINNTHIMSNRHSDISFIGQLQYDNKILPVSLHRQLMWEKLGKLNKYIVTRCETQCHNHLLNNNTRPRFPKSFFQQVMIQSKIAISPFGFAAWSTRDIECLMYGCIVIKPECNEHIIIPDILNSDCIVFCKKDYSDLEEVVDKVLSNIEYYQEKNLQTQDIIEKELSIPVCMERLSNILHNEIK